MKSNQISKLVIDQNLTIDASGLANPVTIDGNGAVTHQRVVQVTEGVCVVLDPLVITGGTTPGTEEAGVESEGGGGIHNAGTLTIHNSVIGANTPGSGGSSVVDQGIINGAAGGAGGGIFNTGTLALANVTVSGSTEPPPARSLSRPPAVRSRPARKAIPFQ